MKAHCSWCRAEGVADYLGEREPVLPEQLLEVGDVARGVAGAHVEPLVEASVDVLAAEPFLEGPEHA